LLEEKTRLLEQKCELLERRIRSIEHQLWPAPESPLFEDTEDAEVTEPPQSELLFVYLRHVQRPFPDVTNMLIDPHWTVEHTKNLIRINEGYGDDVQLSLLADNGDVMQDDLPLAAYDILRDEIIQVDTRPLP
jgi:hypothetical protein